MDKDRMERIFAKGGVTPVERVHVRNYDIFLGEGFSLAPHRIYRKFGVDATDFPSGMYVTWWWIGKDEKLDTGRPLFFDVFHDPKLDPPSKKKARIAAAIADAKDHMQQRVKHALAS